MKRKMKTMKIDGVKISKKEAKELIEELKNKAERLELSDSDKLTELFEMQKDLQGQMFGKETPIDSVEDYHYSMTALVSEIGEVLSADKRWKNARNSYYSREEKLEELVDCMAFLINAILYSGYTPDEFYKAFVEKNKKNFERIS